MEGAIMERKSRIVRISVEEEGGIKGLIDEIGG